MERLLQIPPILGEFSLCYSSCVGLRGSGSNCIAFACSSDEALSQRAAKPSEFFQQPAILNVLHALSRLLQSIANPLSVH